MPRGSNIIDLTGQVFGRWTVLGYSRNTGRTTYWKCQCECGTERDVTGPSIRHGLSTSCGCYQREDFGRRATRHGLSRSRVYRIWRAVLARCCNPNNDEFSRYGGRGVTVCKPWQESFEAFHADMGDPPTERHTIDRIDNDKCYEPNNCRWVTPMEQSHNRRNNRTLTLNGKTQTFAEWARETGMAFSTIRYRASLGLTDEEVLTKPADKKHFRPRKPRPPKA